MHAPPGARCAVHGSRCVGGSGGGSGGDPVGGSVGGSGGSGGDPVGGSVGGGSGGGGSGGGVQRSTNARAGGVHTPECPHFEHLHPDN